MKNGVLKILVFEVNHSSNIENELTYPITLSANGQLISGDIISRKEFYQTEHNSIINRYAALMDKNEIEKYGEIREIPLDELKILHLKNAAYWINGTKIPSGDGTYMIVNIDSVDAFNIGALKIS